MDNERVLEDIVKMCREVKRKDALIIERIENLKELLQIQYDRFFKNIKLCRNLTVTAKTNWIPILSWAVCFFANWQICRYEYKMKEVSEMSKRLDKLGWKYEIYR